MPPINPYDKQLLQRQAAINRRILKIYQDSIREVTIGLSTITYKGKPFALKDYPALQQKVDRVVNKMQPKIYTTMVNGIKDSWDLSNKKNDVLVDKRLAGGKIKPKVKQALYDPNRGALDAYLNRKEKGLGLSDRVWNTMDPFKKELEQGLGFGISKGDSAADMAKQMKKYLVEPDKLFRKVRSEEGKLVLSKAARDYHPGQGVYRSSYKNALRLTRTENNGAYREADHERWQKLPFVIGIDIKLSNAHPRFDICDHMVGRYPKDFKFTGWHPQCICFATPAQLSDEEFEKLEDQILAGQPVTPPENKLTKQPPASFGQWIKDNKQKLAKLKTQPYWVRDNQTYVQQANKIAKKGKLPVDLRNLDLSQYVNRITAQEKYNGVFPDLTIEEKASIHGYTDNEYFTLNSYLRGLNVSRATAAHHDNYRNLLNNALDSIPEKFKGKVYRGTRLNAEQIQVYKDAHKAGKPVMHNYFTSTTTTPGQEFEGNVVFTIVSKNGRDVKPISWHPREDEVLFKSGSRFKVDKISKGSDGKTYIYLEEVN